MAAGAAGTAHQGPDSTPLHHPLHELLASLLQEQQPPAHRSTSDPLLQYEVWPGVFLGGQDEEAAAAAAPEAPSGQEAPGEQPGQAEDAAHGGSLGLPQQATDPQADLPPAACQAPPLRTDDALKGQQLEPAPELPVDAHMSSPTAPAGQPPSQEWQVEDVLQQYRLRAAARRSRNSGALALLASVAPDGEGERVQPLLLPAYWQAASIVLQVL